MDTAFSPEKLFPSSIPAGLLAYSTFENLPTRQLSGSGHERSKDKGDYSSGDCSGFSLNVESTGFPIIRNLIDADRY